MMTRVYWFFAAVVFCLISFWVVSHSFFIVSLGSVLFAMALLAILLFVLVPAYIRFCVYRKRG